MTERSLPLSELHVAMSKLAAALPAIGLEVLRGATEELFVEVAGPRSPVGSYPRTSIHPGKYAASHRVSVGRKTFARLPDAPSYPRLGAAEAAAALREMRLDSPVFITNDATTDGSRRSYAPILEGGRRPDSRGRMIGSEQAPFGVYGPAIRDGLTSAFPRVAGAAFTRALRTAGL